MQGLIALKQRVQAARRKTRRDPAALDAQLDEVRRFSRALRPIYLEEAGLVAALVPILTPLACRPAPFADAGQGRE